MPKTLPEFEKELFDRLRRTCNGYPKEAVVGAAANVLVNAIRQCHPSESEAKALFAKIEVLLQQHYDVSGTRAERILVPAMSRLN